MSLRLKIDKSKMVDMALLWAIYLQLVILEFFGYGRQLNKILTVLILLRILLYKRKIGLMSKKCILIAFTFVLYGLGCLLGDSIEISNVTSNFLMLLYPIVYVTYIVYICRVNPQLIDSILTKGFWIFNLTMVINLIVLSVQISQPYSIMAVRTVGEISFYEDLISGLFAYASTNVVCIYTAFIVVYNMSYFKKIQNLLLKGIFIVYMAIVVAFSFFIAMNNDNKAMFMILPLVVMIYFIMNGAGHTKIEKWVIALCGLPIIFFLLYSCNSAVRSFMDNNVFKVFTIINNSLSLGNQANGSNERISIIGYALMQISTWFLGKGFGSSYIYSSGYLGFKHFGQADFGMLLILGGIWFTFLLLKFYVDSFYEIVIVSNGCKKRKIIKVEILILFFCIIIYTQCVTRTNVTTCLILVMLAYRLKMNKI